MTLDRSEPTVGANARAQILESAVPFAAIAGTPRRVMTDVESNPATAAAAFVARHQRGTWRWLRQLGCDPHRADEHCQDALLAALHLGLEQRPANEAAAWLRTASKNLFWMRLRQERRQPPVLAIETIEAHWRRFGGEDDGGDGALQALAHCRERLDADDRKLLDERYRDGAPRAAMATARGITEAGIKMALRRARVRLRACIEQHLHREDER